MNRAAIEPSATAPSKNRRGRPRLPSLNVLVLAGFAVVALPLIAAIMVTTGYVDQLARESAETVTVSTRAARNAQMIRGQVATLERNARQYRVLGSPELLRLYRERHGQLMQSIRTLKETVDDPAIRVRLDRLETAAGDARDAVADGRAAAAGDRSAGTPPHFKRLSQLAGETANAVSGAVDRRLETLRTRATDIERVLFWQAWSVIPLAVSLAALFTVLIARPVRALGRAIRQLGEGDMQSPVRVRGPLDLEALGGRMEWLRQRLNELEKQKQRFLSHMSHELKTPLTNVCESAELLLDGSVGSLSPPQREVADILQENSVELQHSIEGLLQLNAWKERRMRPLPEPCDIHRLVRDTLARHRLRLARRSLSVDTRLEAGTVMADADQLRVMIDNLVSNAIKHSPVGGAIHVRSRRDPDWVWLEVADEGLGVAPADRERIFEAFVQGRARSRPDATVPREHLKGTGIGLAVVRECARAHGGEVILDDGEFPGACFRIRLPGRRPVDAANDPDRRED